VTTPKSAAISGTVLLVCITTMMCFVVGIAALVWIFAPGGNDPTVLVSTLVGTLAPTIAVMAALAKIGNVSEQVADVAEDANKMANGLGDSKIRAAVADVLPDHLIDPASRQLVESDRLRRLMPEEHQ
jgi:hypothetical protein